MSATPALGAFGSTLYSITLALSGTTSSALIPLLLILPELINGSRVYGN
jgi:hypothetical protein